jgi:catechol 2,3-dioxygenase-like lactoylglutathione lyase family enzyme
MGDTQLDHVALAVRRWSDARAVLVEALGGQWVGGVRTPEYNPGQLSFANGMRVELLEPGPDTSSFLNRFVARSGAGPHHVTFKVDDIRAAIKHARDAGFEITRERLDDPGWQEAFLHPKSTGIGFVIQMAQSTIDSGKAMSSARGSISAEDAGLANGAPGEAAAIPFFTAAVPDLASATEILSGLLHGQVTGEGSSDGVSYRSVSWQPGGASIVLTTGGADGDGTPPIGIKAIAATGTKPDLPVDRVAGGWALTPVIAELGVRLLTQPG